MEDSNNSASIHRNELELRQCQAELYECVVMGKEDYLELFNKYQDVLDEEISIRSSDVCQCARDFESFFLRKQKEQYLDDMTKCVRMGTCSCSVSSLCQLQTRTATVRLVHVAAGCGQINMLKSLASFKCNFNVSSSVTRLTPLFISVYLNLEDQVDVILSQKVDVNQKSLSDQKTPLIQAVCHRRKSIVEKLLRAPNIDLNACDGGMETAILSALRYDLMKIFEILMDAGADINVRDAGGNTPTMLASVKGVEYLKPLLTKKPDLNCKNKRNETALFYATYVENEAVVDLLLESGADPDVVSSDEMTALITAACQGTTSLVGSLIKHGANINQANSQGYNAVHMAAWNNHTRMLRMLLDREGVQHDLQTGDKNTPLSLAAHGNHAEAVEILLQKGCNVNNADKDLDTALHYAAYNGMTDTVKLLLQYGGNPEVLNNFNTSPLWNAVCMKHKNVVKILLAENVRMEIPSVGIHQHMQSNTPITIYSQPQTALYVAADKESDDIVCLLIAAGYNIHKEPWIYHRNFPFDEVENRALVNLLITFSAKPPSLIRLCRNYLRTYFGRRIHSAVQSLEIPIDLKNSLLLKDLMSVSDA